MSNAMSHYRDLLTPPQTGVKSFLWKINPLGEVVIERVSPETLVVSSSRGMVMMGNVGTRQFADNLNEVIRAETGLVVTERIPLWKFNVETLQELCDKLNSKKPSKAKTVWSAIPSELEPDGIEYIHEEAKFVVRKPKPEPTPRFN